MSDLWSTPASTVPQFEHLGEPTEEDLAEWRALMESPEYKAELDRRLAPYRTKVTRQTLDKELD